MSTQDIVTLVGNAATFLTAVAALLTIREMKRQRQSSYKPELVVGSVPLSVRGAFQDPLSVTARAPGAPPTQDHILRFHAAVPCTNVGLGSAHHVSWAWSFDIDEAIARIYGLGIPIPFEIWKEHPFITVVGSASHIKYMLGGHLTGNQLCALAASQDATGFPIEVPGPYLALYASYLIAIAKPDDQFASRMASTPPFPDISLSLSYRDVEQNTHSKLFRFRFSLAYVSQEGATEPDAYTIEADATLSEVAE